MIRLPRPALAVLAVFTLVAAGACGSSTATAGPAATSAASAAVAPGGSSAAGATTGPAGASAAPALNPNDPNSIITQVISGGTAVKSFHIKIEVNGTIKAAALSSAGSGAAAGLKGDLKLDGTVIEGDVNVAKQEAHLTLAVPAMPAMGNVPITGDIILVGGSLYTKVSILGPKYSKTDLSSLSSLAGGIPVAVPTPGASALSGVQDEVTKLRKQLDQAGVKATLVGVEQVAGKDAYHINVSVPLDLINTQIAAAASAGPGMKIDSASVDFWVYKDNNMPAKVEIKGASSALGNIGLTVTVTNYDKPVTITAPPASEVATPAP